YIALTQRNDAARGLLHFQNHGRDVSSPISLARTHYWQGRAHDALGDTTAAQLAYTKGARHQTAFYGLLSAEKTGVPLDPALTGAEQFPTDPDHLITQDSNYQAAQLLYDAGFARLSIRFLTHLAETQNRQTVGVMTALAEQAGRPNFELLLAKRAVKYGMVIHRSYFPLHPLAGQTGDVPTELALAIARRESEFFADAISGVGARGLMQLMPPTAQEMAGDLGMSYSQSRLTTDPAYNATLGVAYLRELIERFGYSPVHIAAAYNAGPSRPERWMGALGDPRQGDIDVIDWIERIPFSETRNYVMRVTETLPAYRARLTGQTGPVAFTQLLNGTYVPPPPGLGPKVSLRPRVRP
ncbi:MAG: lytic transglycosylase domain-containing protein, partial [Pseudomonadota bacterium]